VVVDAEHRPLVIPDNSSWNEVFSVSLSLQTGIAEETMGRGILLWLLGVPIPVIILLWLFFGH
jgi:hypothetical protein